MVAHGFCFFADPVYPATESLPPPAAPSNSAVRAGWICYAVFVCTFWVPLVGGLCFVATIALAIVALATNQVRAGLILFFTTAASGILIGLAVLMFGIGILGMAAKGVQTKLAVQQREMARAQPQMTATMPTPPPFRMFVPPAPVARPPTAGTPVVVSPRPTHPPVSQPDASDLFARQARLTSIMGGEPPIAIINGKSYELGQEIVVPGGVRLRVNAVTAETVTLRGLNRDYQLRLR